MTAYWTHGPPRHGDHLRRFGTEAPIDVSTRQVVKAERPAFGRSYQTPYADRIRNGVGRTYGVAVIAVGAISSNDDVNSILLAARLELIRAGEHGTRHARRRP